MDHLGCDPCVGSDTVLYEVAGDFSGLAGMHFPVQRYYKEHFALDRFYKLILSPDDSMTEEELVCLESNRLNYGMPDIRFYKDDSIDIDSMRAELLEGRSAAILVATTGWLEDALFKSLIEILTREFPSARILLRPHPTYEDHARHIAENLPRLSVSLIFINMIL